MSSYTVVNNKRQSLFEIEFPSGEKAILEYRWLKGSMVLMRTLVPKEERGKGAGNALAKAALEHAASNHLKVIVYCAFVEQYIKQHKEYEHLLLQKG